jgi:hypothetical protein
MARAKTVASPLSRKAVLVAVNISQWTARKLDRRVTDEVNEAHGAAKDAGRYNKLLIEADRLKEINKLVSHARDLHHKLTKPWADEGPRILPNVLYGEFANKFRVLKRDFAQAADDFCRDYPKFVEERKVALNGLFKQSDYPEASEIRGKFKLDLVLMPFPDATDFRADVEDEIAEEMRAEIKATSKNAVDVAMQDTAKQIRDVVGHMVKKLAEFKSEPQTGLKGRKFFLDSLVPNVRELAARLPAFNLTDDPKLAKIAKRIKDELCVEETAKLREDDNVRAVVQKSAESIMRDMSKFMA